MAVTWAVASKLSLRRQSLSYNRKRASFGNGTMFSKRKIPSLKKPVFIGLPGPKSLHRQQFLETGTTCYPTIVRVAPKPLFLQFLQKNNIGAWRSLVARLLWDYGAVFTVLSEEPHKHWLFQPLDFNIFGFDHNFDHNYRFFLSVTFVPSVTDFYLVFIMSRRSSVW